MLIKPSTLYFCHFYYESRLLEVQAGFDFLDLEVVLPSISLLGVGLELGNY